MALTRSRSFTAGGLGFNDLEAEFNNFRDYINNRTLQNPLTQDLDFGNQFTVDNLRTFWNIRNGEEFGGRTGSSIQAAINDLPVEGGVVLLPGGAPYILTQTLNLRSGVALWGAGWGATILQRTSTATAFTATSGAMILGNSVNGVMLKDLQIDGAGVSNASQGGLTLLRSDGASSRFVIDHCYIKGSGAAGNPSADPNDGIRIHSTGRGFWITRCLFEDFRRNGISVVHADRFFILDSEFTDTGGSTGPADSNTAIDIEPQSGQSTRRGIIDHNIIRGWVVSGIVALNNATLTVDEDRGKLTIANNEISDCGVRGILVQLMRNVKVLGNTIDQAFTLGATTVGALHILNCVDVTVADNDVYRANPVGNADGIMVQGSGATQACSDILVEGNRTDTIARHSIILNVISSGLLNNVDIIGNRTKEGGQNAASAAEIKILPTSGTMNDISILGNTGRVTSAALSPHHGIDFDGAVSNVLMVGNRMRQAVTGAGNSINGRANVTNLEEGHNQEV